MELWVKASKPFEKRSVPARRGRVAIPAEGVGDEAVVPGVEDGAVQHAARPRSITQHSRGLEGRNDGSYVTRRGDPET